MKYDPARGAEAGKKRSLSLRRRKKFKKCCGVASTLQ
jgi:hypothetical protein